MCFQVCQKIHFKNAQSYEFFRVFNLVGFFNGFFSSVQSFKGHTNNWRNVGYSTLQGLQS